MRAREERNDSRAREERNDSGVFPVRNAVERARPQAGVVPAVPRDAACAVGPRAWSRVERPSDSAAAGAGGLGSPPAGVGRTPARLPTGYRWIAVRPGAAPPPRRRRRPLGPTPRYAVIPRWGLVDHFEAPELQAAGGAAAPPLAGVRATLIATMVGARCRRTRACGALRAADRQPIGVVEQGGGVRSDLVGRARQRHRAVHGRRQRGGADQLADRPAGRGVRAPPARAIHARYGRCARVALCRW